MLRKILQRKYATLFVPSIFRHRLFSCSQQQVTQKLSEEFNPNDPYAEQKALLKVLGVNKLDGPLPIVDRATLPGEYAISRKHSEGIFKNSLQPTEEEIRANGEALKKASFGY